jgi:hypothetical protein
LRMKIQDAMCSVGTCMQSRQQHGARLVPGLLGF